MVEYLIQTSFESRRDFLERVGAIVRDNAQICIWNEDSNMVKNLLHAAIFWN